MYRGQPSQPIDPALPNVGPPRLLWLLAALGHGLVLSLACSIVLVMMISYDPYGYQPGPGQFALWYLLGVATTGISLIGRAGVLMALFRILSDRIGFIAAANLASINLITATPAVLVALIASLQQGTFTTVLAVLAGLFTLILGELSTYVAVATTGRFTRPMVVHYTWLTFLWVVVMAVIWWLWAADILGNVWWIG
ncbi:MAG: hypothetical protein ACK5KO_09815 [Arachnia sp.]